MRFSRTARTGTLVALLLFGANCASAKRDQRGPVSPELAITNVSVIDVGNAAGTRNGMTVVVSSRRIVGVYPTDARRFADGVRVIDGRGQFLIPGLWDMHVHAFSFPESSLALGKRATEQYFPRFLSYGVTGIRDMGAWLDTVMIIRQRVRAHHVLGPRIVAAGQLFGGRSPWSPPSPHVWVATNADSIAAAVDSLQRGGADFIKAHDLLTRPTYMAVARRAREAGLPLVGHLRPGVTLEEAIDAGQVGIEHVPIELVVSCAGGGERMANEFYDQWIKGGWATYIRRTADLWAARDPVRCGAIMAKMRDAGVRVTPTLILRMQDSALLSTVPLQALTAANAKRCASDVAEWGAVHDTLRSRHYATVFDIVRTLNAAGVRILAGTDGPGGCLAPGFALHQELENLVRAGLTPFQALRAATIEPALFLGLADSLGTIAPGQLADLVLLEANPLTDIRNTRRVVGVVADGRWVDRIR